MEGPSAPAYTMGGRTYEAAQGHETPGPSDYIPETHDSFGKAGLAFTIKGREGMGCACVPPASRSPAPAPAPGRTALLRSSQAHRRPRSSGRRGLGPPQGLRRSALARPRRSAPGTPASSSSGASVWSIFWAGTDTRASPEQEEEPPRYSRTRPLHSKICRCART